LVFILLKYVIFCFTKAKYRNMTEATNSLDDWEFSKENVQPLRQGRSFNEMSAAIQPSNAARIKEEQEYAFHVYITKTRTGVKLMTKIGLI